MDECFGSQYALQIALQTLRERCQQFQQRIATLEEENINLRSRVNVDHLINDESLSEIDMLKQQVSELTEQKMQLSNNLLMVSAENRKLWARLSKLTQVNENLGSKLSKINSTLTQHNTNAPQNPQAVLIRSKTFTQDEPHIKLIPKNVKDENDKISLELEDISLKLISTIAKEKSELELQCSQMAEIQNNDTVFINSFAFAYPMNQIDNTTLNELDKHLTNLKDLKHILIQETKILQNNLSNLKAERLENTCENANQSKYTMAETSVQTSLHMEDKSTEDDLELLAKWGAVHTSVVTVNNSNSAFKTKEDMICPMCCKIYSSTYKFKEFQDHVESHFINEAETFEILP